MYVTHRLMGATKRNPIAPTSSKPSIRATCVRVYVCMCSRARVYNSQWLLYTRV